MGFPVPIVLAYIVAVVEVVGGLSLVLGAFVRWTTLPLSVVMVVASAVQLSGGGFGGARLDLLLLSVLVLFVFTGAGKISIDHVLSKRK